MPRRELTPEDYDSNLEFVYDLGFEDVDLEDPERTYYNCSACAAGKCDECQEHWTALCKCFLNDHMEVF